MLVKRAGVWVMFVVLFGTLFGLMLIIWYQTQLTKNTITLESSVKGTSEVKGIASSDSANLKLSPKNSDKPIKSAVLRTVYFGLWTQGFWDPASHSLHPEALTSFESKIGKHAAIAHYYRGWEALDSSEFLNELNVISSYGWRPMISANPYFFSKCQANGLPLYKAIANGNCDEFIKNIGKNLKQFGKPLFLRFAWEMNISSMEWQIAKTGNSDQDFVAAWRHIHELVYSEGATNVLWVFSPDAGNTSYKDIYPGDAYVDWIGLDGYNWGITQSWSTWQNFSNVFSSAYYNLTKLAPSKPLMLAEVNTTDRGGDKPGWYKDMLAIQVPLNFPKIKAVVFYNEDRTVKENVNWLIDLNSASLDAFSENIQSPIYKSSF